MANMHLPDRVIQLSLEDVCIYIRVVLLEINLWLHFEVGNLSKKIRCCEVPPLLSSRLPAPTTVAQG